MKKAAMYLRLSKEDEYTYDESNSIASQREILRKHIRSLPEYRGIEIVELKDDGFSGKSMDRPGMQELLAMVKWGEVGTIFCKDLSRFSRDYLVLGEYLEQIFPFMGVRFVAVNDGYDSRECVGGIGEIDVGFKGILYDYYSEDLSVKVKSALNTAKRKGKFSSAFAPYGYLRDPLDRHKVIINEEVAWVVREIFRWAGNGEAYNGIATFLNNSGVECPSVYKERVFGAKSAGKYKRRVWMIYSIKAILSDEFYVGTYVYNKYESVETGKTSRRVKDRSKWGRFYNHHPAIISEEEFERVQEVIKGRRLNWDGTRRRHMLSGKVFCGICGASLSHKWDKYPAYVCIRNYRMPKDERHEGIRIRDDVLEPAILAELNRIVRLRADADKVCSQADVSLEKRLKEGQCLLSELEASLERMYGEQKEAYENYRLGIQEDAARERYLADRKRLEDSIEEMMNQIEVQRSVVSDLENQVRASSDCFDELMEGLSVSSENGERNIAFEKLTEEVVERLLDRVIVHQNGKVEIVWTFGKG